MRTVKVELTSKFIVYAVASMLLLLIAWEIREVILSILGMLFIAFILNAGLRPLVNALEKLHIPRGFAVFLIYAGFLAVIIFIVVVVTNEFFNQVVNLIKALPGIVSRFAEFLQTNVPVISNFIPLDLLQQELGNFAKAVANSQFVQGLIKGENLLAVLTQTAGVVGGIVGLLIGAFTVMVVSVYMLIRKQDVYEGILTLFPKRPAASLRNVLQKIETSLGSWMVGQLSAMIIVGAATYLIILVPALFDPTYPLARFALPIALLAALLEALPNIGPFLTLIVTVIIALGTSGLGTVAYIAVAFTALQQLEGIFIIPMVMKRAIGIDPILSILGIIAGFQLGGIGGAILAIPIIGIALIFISEFAEEYKRYERQRPRLVD